MARPQNLVTIFWSCMTLLYLCLASVLTYFWISSELKLREAEFNQVRENYIAARKTAAKSQVDQAIRYIRHKKSLAEQRVKEAVQSRTWEAWRIAHHIWNTHSAVLDRETVKRAIYDALYAAVWDKGRGYYFIEDMAGNEIMNRNNPEMEGRNILDLVDSKGKYITRSLIAAVQNPDGEGFADYHWNKPGAPGVQVPKISFVKRFAPLGWLIGNGKYIADEEEAIKAEVLAYLENLRYDGDNYLFAGTFDGVSLSGPFKGKNTLDITDANGVKIVRQLIRAARSGGGFVNYVAPGFKGRPPKPKISYARAVEEWGWYVGTGVYVDAVESLIDRRRGEHHTSNQTLVVKSIAALVLFLAVSMAMAWLLSGRIKQNLDLFIRFFEHAATRQQPMSDDLITFSEFIPIARSANHMVAARNSSEDALRKSEKKYRRLFEQSKDALLIIENEIFVDCNQATVDMLGYKDKAELLSTHPSELSPPTQPDGRDSYAKARDMMATAVRNGSHRFEWDHVRADGRVFPVEVLLTAISTEQGNQIIHTTWRDITDRKNAEAMMIQTEKMITVGGLAAGMAHEINNPLAGMMQNAQVIHNRLFKALPANKKAAEAAGIDLNALKIYMEKRDIPKFLSAIHDTGNRAARIVRNMLNFIRKQPAEKSKQDLAEILDQTLELAQNDYDLKKAYDIRKIHIQKHYDPDVPQVSCDESNIQQVFFNIIKNAAHAMAGKDYHTGSPHLILRISKADKTVNVEIQDNGPGMEENVRRRIFEPFYTTKPVNTGTGLGLSVSYFIIVQDHGGTMAVTSSPHRGTTFSISLPV